MLKGLSKTFLAKKAQVSSPTWIQQRSVSSKKSRLSLLCFTCSSVIHFTLMDSQFFADFILALAPNFIVPDRSSFFPKHLAQEVAVWGKKFKAFLEGRSHFTMLLDSWSTKAKDEIHTVHITTPKQCSFFTDGHVFKSVSVTGDALKDDLIQVRTSSLLPFCIMTYELYC